MTSQIRPNLFIGSARESIKFARAVHAQLGRVAQVTPWYAGTFGANSYTMEALEQQLNRSDFGVFIFSPDDVALVRGKYVFTTRDNTVFEMGLFWGKLRRRRVFCIMPMQVESRDDLVVGQEVKEFHLLSDLQGLTIVTYDARRDDHNYEAAVDVACGQIADAIEAVGVYPDPVAELRRKQSILQFFWEYNRNVTIADPSGRYHALSEAVRNSLLPPDDYRVTGAAFWQKQGSEGIGQVGGNVGRGKFFPFEESQDMPRNKHNIVLDAFMKGKLEVFHERDVARTYVLCYPLGKEHVLSVHVSGARELSLQELDDIIEQNEELLGTIDHLIGGDS
jgi:predicted nucleotide-binding protein